MRNNELYKQLEVIAKEYTVTQIKNATKEQVCRLLDVSVSSMTDAFFGNAKNCLLAYVQNREDEADLLSVKSQVTSWLNSNFPDWQVDRGRENDKPFVKIWLNGRPE